MIKYIPASELKKNYTVYGSFYNIILKNEIIKCRNRLEILNNRIISDSENISEVFDNSPDALAIMMNPGSSRPLLKDYSEPVYELEGMQKNIFLNKMVLAKPDTTQYQIMRIMEHMKWIHLRVLNLSDIREPKCNIFYDKVINFEKDNGCLHSVFSEKRSKERKNMLKTKNNKSPIIIGWGCNKSLSELVKKAINSIDKSKIIGIPYGVNNLYRHPLPTLHKAKLEWLELIKDKLDQYK